MTEDSRSAGGDAAAEIALLPQTRTGVEAVVAKATLVEVTYATGATDRVLLPGDACSRFEVEAGDTALTLRGPGLRIIASGDDQAAPPDPKQLGFSAPLRFGASLRSVEDRPGNRAARNAVTNLRMMDLGSESLLTLENTEGMFSARIPDLPTGQPGAKFPLRAGVLVHLFYHDLWDEFAAFIRASGLGENVFVSLTDDRDGIRDRILADFPFATLRLVPNRGRDVAPFLSMYAEGLFATCDVLCKLHSKKSAVAQGEYLGQLWRRRNLFDLIGGRDQVDAILDRFADCPRLGMIGSPAMRLPNARFPDPEHETHLPTRADLLRKLGKPARLDQHDFFAGTMFWVRPSALSGIEGLATGEGAFTDERLQIGENIEHAIERLFADLVRANGYRLSDAVPFRPGPAADGVRRTPLPNRRNAARNATFLGRSDDFRARWTNTLPDDLSNRDVALFATFSETGALLPYTARYLAWLRDTGHLVVPLVATWDVDACDAAAYSAMSDHVFLRENGGFDFSMWSSVLGAAPQLWNARSVLLCNDSVLGPGRTGDLVARLTSAQADVVGLTESHEGRRHLQSYFLRLNRGALEHPEIRDYFTKALAWSHKTEVSHRYEIGLTDLIDAAGLQTTVLYPLGQPAASASLNPTLHFWRQLLDQGFPFIKAEVLRDAKRLASQLWTTVGDVPPDLDAAEMTALLQQHGFDPDLVRGHVGRMREERSRNVFLDAAPGRETSQWKILRRRLMRLLGIRTKKERRTARLGAAQDRSH